jgi:hypothetical protein
VYPFIFSILCNYLGLIFYPIANNIGVLNLILPPYIVANHENIFIPVGTAIIIVAAVKYALVFFLDYFF